MQNQLLINGQLVAGQGATLEVFNPSTGAVLTQIAEASPEPGPEELWQHIYVEA